MAGAPGFEKHPDYSVDLQPQNVHIRVLAGSTVIADTQQPIAVRESRHHPVWYLPMADVDQTLIEATETSTYCPFKGHASYWTLRGSDGALEDAMWSYLDPYDECLLLAGYVAFYTDRVDMQVDGEIQERQGPGWTDR